MVAVAAFLIVCVILFGIENVRNFFFGTLGVVGWAIAIFIVFGLLCLALDKIGEMIKEDKELKAKGQKAKNTDTFAVIIIMALIFGGAGIYLAFFMPKYYILYRFNDQAKWAVDNSAQPGQEASCKSQVASLNAPGAAFEYACAKNCEKDSTGVYITKCEEIY